VAVPLVERIPKTIVDDLFSLLGFRFSDFVSMTSQQQLDRLVASAQSFPAGSQYLFSSLNDIQRSHVLAESNEYQRFQLYQKYDLKNKGLLLALLSQSEVETYLNWEEFSTTTKVFSLLNDDQRQSIIRKMTPRLQAKLLLHLDDGELKTIVSYFTENQKKNLASQFTRIRVSNEYPEMDFEFVTRNKGFGKFLDSLAQYFTRFQSFLLLTTHDPVVFLSRFTPRERQALFQHMRIQEKKWMLEELDGHKLKNFPNDFFDSDMIRNSYFVGDTEWKKLWNEVRFEVSEYERLEKVRKEFFNNHRRAHSNDLIQTFKQTLKDQKRILHSGESFQGYDQPRGHIRVHSTGPGKKIPNYGLKLPKAMLDPKNSQGLERMLSTSV
jgi:hypothetical protein